MPPEETTDITHAWHVLAFKKIDNSLADLQAASDVPHIGIAKQSAPGATDAASPPEDHVCSNSVPSMGAFYLRTAMQNAPVVLDATPFQESPEGTKGDVIICS